MPANHRWPKPKAADRDIRGKVYRIPDRGLCPQGHPYDVNYTNYEGQPRTYCHQCDTRPHNGEGHGLSAGYESRACWGCGRMILVILYHPQEAKVICSFDCYTQVAEQGRAV